MSTFTGSSSTQVPGYLISPNASSTNGYVYYSWSNGSYGPLSVRYFSNTTQNGQYNNAYGTRPVVVMKAGVKSNASKDTAFLSQTCWAVK